MKTNYERIMQSRKAESNQYNNVAMFYSQKYKSDLRPMGDRNPNKAIV